MRNRNIAVLVILVVLLSLSLFGCGSGGGVPLTGIGSEGGIIEISGENGESLKIEIPEGALANNTNVSVSLVDDPNAIPSADSIFPKVILGPEGTIFEKPISLTFQITDEALENAGITSLDEVIDYLNVYYWNSGSQLWEPLTITEVDPNSNIVVAETDHFSQFQVVVNWYGIERVALISQIKKGESFRMKLVSGSRKTDGTESLMANIGFAFRQTIEMLFVSNSEVPMEFVFEAPDEIGFHYLEIYSPIARVLLWRQQLVVDYETNVSNYTDLIEQYSPILVFGKWDIEPWNKSFPNGEELYLPASIESVLEGSKLGFGKVGLTILSLLENPTIDDLSEFADTRHILDFKGNEKIGTSGDKVIYATAVEQGEYIYLQYWFFYPFDAKSGDIIPCLRNCGSDPECCLKCFLSELGSLQFLTSHYGDFESIVVVLRNTGSEIKEEYVVYGQHLSDQRMEYLDESEGWEGDGVRVPWTSTERDGTHPLTYVALGSHGCYPRRGIYGVYPKVLGIEVEYKEMAGGGEKWYPSDYAIEYLPRMFEIYPGSPYWESKKFLWFSGQWGNNRWRFADIRLMTHTNKWFVVDWVNGLRNVSFGEIPEPEPPVNNFPWPMFMSDPRHTGQSQYSGPATENLLWGITADDLYNPLIVGKDGTIYTTEWGVTGHLGAYNPDGSLKWRFDPEDINYLKYHGISFESSPVVGSDGTIYIMGHSYGDTGGFFAINPNGSLKWIKDGACLTDLTIGSDDTIYVGRGSGIDAFYPNGNLKWSCDCGRVEYHAPAIGSDGTVCAAAMSRLVAINSTGTEKWRLNFSGTILVAPAIGPDGTIYTGTYLNFYAVNPNGSVKWEYAANGDYDFASPAISSDGTIYIGFDGYLHAINPSGSLKWKVDLPGICGTLSPNTLCIDKNGVIYAATCESLLAINPDGTLKWEYYDDYAYFCSPVIGAEGRLYVGYHLSGLWAFGN